MSASAVWTVHCHGGVDGSTARPDGYLWWGHVYDMKGTSNRSARRAGWLIRGDLNLCPECLALAESTGSLPS